MKADDLISTLTWKYLFDCCNAASSQVVSIKFLWFLQKQVRWITKGIIVLIMSWFDYKPSLKLFFFRFYFAETVLAFWSIVTYMGSDAGQPPDSWSPPLTTSCSLTSAWAWWASCLFATNLYEGYIDKKTLKFIDKQGERPEFDNNNQKRNLWIISKLLQFAASKRCIGEEI